MHSFELKIHQIQVRRGSALDPAGGAYDAPSDPLLVWGGVPLIIPLPLDAFGVSIFEQCPNFLS